MKIIVLGDLHFGIKGFNESFFMNQISFFEKQLFPYMEENGINAIVQLGDFLDNRKNMNIKMFDDLNKYFFEPLKEKGFTLHTFLGNHDIYYTNSLKINLMKYFDKLYDNVHVYEKPTILDLDCDTVYKVFPWIYSDEQNPSKEDLSNVDVVFGHFEMKNFEMVKGHINKEAVLSSDYFKGFKNLKRVVSGHYHMKSSDGFVTYVGTPYQLNWGDYKEQKGFYVFEGSDYEFIENTVSSKFVKIKYNDKAPKVLELSGYGKEDGYYDEVDDMPDLSNHHIKFFINESSDKEYEIVSFDLNKKGYNFDVINNVEISSLIGTSYVENKENLGGTELLIETIKKEKPYLLKTLNEFLEDLE